MSRHCRIGIILALSGILGACGSASAGAASPESVPPSLLVPRWYQQITKADPKARIRA